MTTRPMTDGRTMPMAFSKKMSNTPNHLPNHSNAQPSDGKRQLVTKIFVQGQGPATFYIQAKGLHAGRPLEKPIANCFSVTTNIPHLRGIALSIYYSGLLKPNIIGSVVPFIRVTEYRTILTKAANAADLYDDRHLRTLELLTDQIASFQTKIQLFKEYQIMLAASLNAHLKNNQP